MEFDRIVFKKICRDLMNTNILGCLLRPILDFKLDFYVFRGVISAIAVEDFVFL